MWFLLIGWPQRGQNELWLLDDKFTVIRRLSTSETTCVLLYLACCQIFFLRERGGPHSSYTHTHTHRDWDNVMHAAESMMKRQRHLPKELVEKTSLIRYFQKWVSPLIMKEPLTTTTSIYQIFFTVVVKVSNNSTWTEWEAGRRKQVLSSLYFPFGALSGKGREGKGRLGTFEHYCLTNLSLWVGSGGGCQCESPDSCELCAHVCSSWWIEHACIHPPLPPYKSLWGFNAQSCVVGSMHACLLYMMQLRHVHLYLQTKEMLIFACHAPC